MSVPWRDLWNPLLLALSSVSYGRWWEQMVSDLLCSAGAAMRAQMPFPSLSTDALPAKVGKCVSAGRSTYSPCVQGAPPHLYTWLPPAGPGAPHWRRTLYVIPLCSGVHALVTNGRGCQYTDGRTDKDTCAHCATNRRTHVSIRLVRICQLGISMMENWHETLAGVAGTSLTFWRKIHLLCAL